MSKVATVKCSATAYFKLRVKMNDDGSIDEVIDVIDVEEVDNFDDVKVIS